MCLDAVLNLAFALSLLCFIVMHASLISSNTTSIEVIKNVVNLCINMSLYMCVACAMLVCCVWKLASPNIFLLSRVHLNVGSILSLRKLNHVSARHWSSWAWLISFSMTCIVALPSIVMQLS